MKPATEEFLYFLMWSADTLLRPSWRHVTGDSFESWAYRNHLTRRLAELQRLKFIEAREARDGTVRLFRLTAIGREIALAGVEPPKLWERRWDGRWRIVLFDMAEDRNRDRVRLRRSLRNLRFGYLQNSVWISPDPFDAIRPRLAKSAVNVESLVLFDGRPGGGETDQDLVAGAWDFAAISRLYEDWSRIADAAPDLARGAPADERTIRNWAARERAAWAAIAARDPFLPETLLPAGYVGRAVWARRARLLTSLGRALTTSP